MERSSNPHESEAPRAPIMGPGPIAYSSGVADLESLPTRRREVRRRQLKVVALLFLIIAATAVADRTVRRVFLTARAPSVRIDSVAVRGSNTTGGGGDAHAPSFSLRLEAEVAIENPNFGRFEYSGYGFGNNNVVVDVYYRKLKVGEGVIGDGVAGARRTKRVVVAMDLKSGGLTGNSGSVLRKDIDSGSLALTGSAKLTGNVYVAWVLGETVGPELSCSMTVKLDSKTVQDLACL